MPCRSPPDRLETVEIHGDAGAAEADCLKQDLLSELLLALDVDEAETVGDLPTDKEIAPQRLLLGERLVLVDRLDRQIVRHPHRIFALRNLAVADVNLARRRRQHAGHNLDQRRFAGAVVADQPDDLVAADGDVDVAQRVNRAKILLHADKPYYRRIVGIRRPHRHSTPRQTPAAEHARVSASHDCETERNCAKSIARASSSSPRLNVGAAAAVLSEAAATVHRYDFILIGRGSSRDNSLRRRTPSSTRRSAPRHNKPVVAEAVWIRRSSKPSVSSICMCTAPSRCARAR